MAVKPEARAAGKPGLPGWDRLRHGGLLLDATRLVAISRFVPDPLDHRIARQLRQRAGALPGAGGESGDISSFVTVVLEQVCGLDASTGTWTRGKQRLAFLGPAGDHR